MSQGEWIFFWVYVTLQVLIPLRHFLFIFLPGRKRDLVKSDRKRFSWTMKNSFVTGTSYFMTRDRRNGASLGTYQVEDFILEPQASRVCRQPGNAIQFAHFLAKVLHKESGIPLEDIEVRAYLVTDINQRGAEERIDETVDLAREPIRTFTSYPWQRW